MKIIKVLLLSTLTISIAAIAYIVFLFTGTQPSDSIATFPLISATPTPEAPAAFVTIDGKQISYDVLKTTPDRLSLVNNLPSATDSASAKNMYGCSAVTSAGFYTKEHTPLGLLRVNSETIAREIQSTLVDGFLYVTKDGHVSISPTIDESVGTFALQSGPRVRTGGTIRPLKIHTDEFARRIIAATSDKNELYIIVLFMSDSLFGGPLLAQVPEVIELISVKEHLQLVDAINLDGGSASVFITPHRTLSELQPTGGFFCIK